MLGGGVFIPNFAPAFCSQWWSEREVRNVTREVGHLLAFANSGERKDAHTRPYLKHKTS